MSPIDPLMFPDFANATNFCRWIGCGVVRPCSSRAGYVWNSEGAPLDEEQQSRFDAYMGVNSVWNDVESGLTWLYSRAYVSLHHSVFGLHRMSERFFAGFSDWRSPTLTELKTLRSSRQDKNGLWRTPALAGKTGPVLRSVTNGRFDRDERMDWNFREDGPCEDEHRDSKIAWDSEGEYAGFEGGSSRHTGAESIFVRGEYSAQRPEWLKAQVQWAEEHRYDSFPVTEKTIGLLTKLHVIGRNCPPYLEQLTGIRSLSVDGSAALAPTVSALLELESLTWKIEPHQPAAKQEVHLPSEVGKLKQLRKLSVNAPIEQVPDSICDLVNLEELELGWAIEGLPAALGQLSKLRKMRVSGNRMDSLPPSIGQLIALEELCVHAKGLQYLPDKIGHLQSLVLLNMSRCALRGLPSELAALRSLKQLSLEYNQLVEVSMVVCGMPQLESLNLSFNPITALPSEFGSLKGLKSLCLRGAPIVEVPEFLRELTNLETLNLSGTQIQELPQWLWEMKSLRRLTIADTWKLPRKRLEKHPTIVVDRYDAHFSQPWGREWLQRMGKPD